MTDKPREFWVGDYREAKDSLSDLRADEYFIHVIDYSAYKALLKENEELKKEQNWFCVGCQEFIK